MEFKEGTPEYEDERNVRVAFLKAHKERLETALRALDRRIQELMGGEDGAPQA